MDIGIQYISGMLGSNQLEEISTLCNQHNFELKTHDIKGRAYASAAEIAQLFVILSPAILESISLGLITNASYDAIKAIITKCANAIVGKTYYRITSTKQVPQVAKFYIRSSNNELSFEIPSSNSEAIEISINKLVAAYEKGLKKS